MSETYTANYIYTGSMIAYIFNGESEYEMFLNDGIGVKEVSKYSKKKKSFNDKGIAVTSNPFIYYYFTPDKRSMSACAVLIFNSACLTFVFALFTFAFAEFFSFPFAFSYAMLACSSSF